MSDLFSLSHRRSDNSRLLIVFIANYIDQSIVTFIRLKVFRKLWPFDLLIWVDNMPEVTRKLITSKRLNTALRLKYRSSQSLAMISMPSLRCRMVPVDCSPLLTKLMKRGCSDCLWSFFCSVSSVWASALSTLLCLHAYLLWVSATWQD